jgi:hypothetical protein
VSVRNVGSKDAASVSFTFDLPATHTSPTVYPMGTVGALPVGCTRSGTRITCSLGTIKKTKSASRTFSLTLAQSTEPLNLVARATTPTTPVDPTPTNNTANATASLLHHDLPITGPVVVTNTHCTGTGLTSFWECVVSPGSTMTHSVTYEADSSITFPAIYGGDYTGTWWQPTPKELAFEYYEIGLLAAEFHGWATDNTGCFEGITTFPGSIYVSAYEICF